MATTVDPRPVRPRHKPRACIILRLRGGVGNQLFQYAMGRKAALETGSALLFDVTDYDRHHDREFVLGHFNCVGGLANLADCARVLWPAREFGNTAQLLRKVYPFYKSRCVHEKDFAHTPDMPRISANSYLDGYWQRALVPLSIQNTLRKELSLKRPLSLSRQALLSRINAEPSIAIHIRRGDYLKPQNLANYGLCSPAYYQKAKQFMDEVVPSAHYFVFSDDPNWAAGFFSNTSNVTIVSPDPDRKDHEDLVLMAQCSHTIMANSSFSWWAAFLNPNPTKRVVAPAQWFKAANKSADHLMLPSWHLL